MILEDGRLRMRRGDYGVPASLCVTECCQCGEDLEPDDMILAEICREGKVLFARGVSWAELEEDQGLLELFLKPEEAAEMPLGLYTFRVCLVRAGEVHNTLMTSILEVIP